MFSDSIDSALIGAISGGIVAIAIFFAQRRQSKWTVLMSMINEFNAPPMIAARANAHTFLSKKTNESFADIDRNYTDPESVKVKNDIWLLLSFYERLAILIKGNVIATEMAEEIFADTFLWWWGYSFENQLPAEWSASKHTIWLHGWMTRRLANEHKKSANFVKKGRDSRLASNVA